MKLNNSSLHYYIMKHIVNLGYAPKIHDISQYFDTSKTEVIKALKALQDYHGVVLHPNSSEIWVMHPFSTAPTNFWIESNTGSWWGNCAWCSLGAAALLKQNLTITTTLGGESRQITIEIKDGQIRNKNLFIHFPIPMINAWDNVTFTCSTMLMFETSNDIDDWCKRHAIPKGDIQPIDKIWEFSKVWYGNHLNPNWVKWSVDEAKDIFQRFELSHSIWNMPANAGRF
ncbi:alkylmercury lyase family protein [Thalassomonas sp. RHCl1]|uniref:alkylmercury lyase family protein n=1 Tax=Thalassomonas sp. RHCl1 TaxID=2995320 RepID=UPI00248CA0D7|nr:alkylmercury lyase family protein [Thalassomonas sp. RHCl1]